jgi:hypothetical protein
MVFDVTGDRPDVYERGTAEFDRALAFVDAIFGFSVTLLVTTLDVPPAAAWQNLSSLLDSGLGDQLLSFVISFAVVAGFWRSNHQLIRTFHALDAATVRVLVYLVALVVFVPFTTKAISDPNRPVRRERRRGGAGQCRAQPSGPVAWAHRHRRRAGVRADRGGAAGRRDVPDLDPGGLPVRTRQRQVVLAGPGRPRPAARAGVQAARAPLAAPA